VEAIVLRSTAVICNAAGQARIFAIIAGPSQTDRGGTLDPAPDLREFQNQHEKSGLL